MPSPHTWQHLSAASNMHKKASGLASTKTDHIPPAIKFCKYLTTFNNLSVYQPESPAQTTYIKLCSMAPARKWRNTVHGRSKKVLINDIVAPQHVQQVLPAILDKRTSMALMTIAAPTRLIESRITPSLYSPAAKTTAPNHQQHARLQMQMRRHPRPLRGPLPQLQSEPQVQVQ
jgi:hypothetical protein